MPDGPGLNHLDAATPSVLLMQAPTLNPGVARAAPGRRGAAPGPGSKMTDVLHIDNFRALHPEAHAFATTDEAEAHAATTGKIVWTLGEDWRVRRGIHPLTAQRYYCCNP